MTRRKLVVIGNGMCGVRAVEELLARGGAEKFDITIFGDEPYGNYDRILLSSVLAGSLQESDTFINPLSWYAENGVTLQLGASVTEVDRASRLVIARNGVRASYDLLLIATGSRPYMPPIPGMYGRNGKLKSAVFAFRTLDDCRRIGLFAPRCRTAAVIGGEVPALEAARGLANLGCAVHMLHRGTHLMDAQLDAAAGEVLQGNMRAMGLCVHLGTYTTEILGENHVTGVGFGHADTLACDMVVVADGIRPNVDIGARAGLTVERAIVVDDRMRSVDDHDIYAVGECAQHRGKVYGLLPPLWEQARVFAEHVTGRDRLVAYSGSNPTRGQASGYARVSKAGNGAYVASGQVGHYSSVQY